MKSLVELLAKSLVEPVESLGEATIGEGGDPDDVFAAIEELRIPVDYLASFLTAGDPEPVRRSLRRLVAMRRYMRGLNLGGETDPGIAREVGMEPAEIEEMFRMVAIGDYDERYVIPKRHGEASPAAFAEQGSCGIDFAGAAAVMPEADQLAPLGPGPDPLATEKPVAGFDLRDQLVSRGGSDGG